MALFQGSLEIKIDLSSSFSIKRFESSIDGVLIITETNPDNFSSFFKSKKLTIDGALKLLNFL